MANKRMFSNAVIDNDKFLDMPLSTQALYFHLGMKADDDGFIASPKKIIRAVNCTEDDLKLLIAKGFVIGFSSGVIVITHFNINNTLKNDRYTPTIHKDELSCLRSDESKIYKLSNHLPLETEWFQNGSNVEPQYSIDKHSKVKYIEDTPSTSVDSRDSFDYQSVFDSFNRICKSLPKVQKINDRRRKAIKNAGKLLDGVSFEELFTRVEQSDFLTGRSGNWTGCGFDWILKPANLLKVLEGNYNNKQAAEIQRNYDEVF